MQAVKNPEMHIASRKGYESREAAKVRGVHPEGQKQLVWLGHTSVSVRHEQPLELESQIAHAMPLPASLPLFEGVQSRERLTLKRSSCLTRWIGIKVMGGAEVQHAAAVDA